MNQNSNNNFDSITGQPINQQQPVQPQNASNTYSQIGQTIYTNPTNQNINMQEQQINKKYTQQPVQPTMNMDQQPKKKSNTKILIIIAILVVVIIAGIIFIPKLFSNKDNKGNEIVSDASVYNYDEIIDEINIFQNKYSFNASDNVKLHRMYNLYDNMTVRLIWEDKMLYVTVKVYDSFETLINDNIYSEIQKNNINYEINTEDEVLFSSSNIDGNTDIVAYGYKLDNQILGFIVDWYGNGGRNTIDLDEGKRAIYNCKKTISSNKGYKTAQEKLMQYALFGNYMLKNKEMIREINNNGFYISTEYIDKKTNEVVNANLNVMINDNYIFDFEGKITEEKKFDGFNLLWHDYANNIALVIMTKQDYKYYLEIAKQYVNDPPSIDEVYTIFNSSFEKKINNEK